MEGVHQHRAIGARRCAHHLRGLRQIAHIGPGHELQVHAQAIAAGQVTQRRETIGQAGRVGVVAGHQQFGRAQARCRGQGGFEIKAAGFGLEAKDFDIQHLQAGGRQAVFDLAQQRRVADQVVGGLGG